MWLEVRPHLDQRLRDALLQIDRMQSVQHEKGTEQIVLHEGFDQRIACNLALISQFQDTCQPFTIHIQQRLDKFPGCSTYMRVWECRDLLNERLDAFGPAKMLLHVLLHQISPLSNYRKTASSAATDPRPASHPCPLPGPPQGLALLYTFATGTALRAVPPRV